MGRAREFKDEQAIKRAMHLFWQKGYESSSLKDLLTAMDILNGSFYHSFGSKKNLFIKALDFYYEDLSQKRENLFRSSGSFQEKIRAVFDYSLDRQKRKSCPKGCFLVNSMTPDVLEDEDIRIFIESRVEDFETFLEREIRLAIAHQELDASMDPTRTAGIVNIYLQGLLKLCVLHFDEQKYREQTEYFLSAHGL